MNAVTHGLTARTPLLPGEDSEEFRRFVWDIVDDLGPCGPVQAELASRAAVLMWKRRRISDAERLVIEELQNKYVWDAEPKEAETEEPQEGEEIVQGFLSRNAGRRVDLPADLPGFAPISPEGWVRILPGLLEAQGGLDGFFMARLVRGR